MYPLSRVQVMIHSLANAHEQIDQALSAALHYSKPVYICVSCNLAGAAGPRELCVCCFHGGTAVSTGITLGTRSPALGLAAGMQQGSTGSKGGVSRPCLC